jgi:hypothetical protein
MPKGSEPKTEIVKFVDDDRRFYAPSSFNGRLGGIPIDFGRTFRIGKP